MQTLDRPAPSSNSGDALWNDQDKSASAPLLPPPINPALECEAAVIGSVLCRNERYWTCVQDGLRSQHFASELHQRLWDTTGALISAGLEASPMTLLPKFAGDSEFMAQGAHRYLGRLAVMSAGIIDIKAYARTVREWHARRELTYLGGWIEAEAVRGEMPLPILRSEIEAALEASGAPTAISQSLPLSQALQQAQAMHERALERGMVDGVPFGLRTLDHMMGGIAKSDVVVLAGRPGMGKSALALHVALANARQGRTVVIFSLEMSAAQFASRAIALEAEVGSDALRRGTASGAALDAARRAVTTLEPLKLIFNQSSGIDALAIRAEVRRLRAAGEIHLLIVDYLQLMEPPPGCVENRVQQIAATTKALKAIAMEFELPVLVLSQLNRAVESRDDKRPQLADLRESGTIEQDADSVILIYRDAYYAQRQEASATGDARERLQERLERHEGQAELIVAKNRHGATGTAIVGFEDALMRFHDLHGAKPYEPVVL